MSVDHDVWPVCSKCGANYVHRRLLRPATGEWVWTWQPDCRHGKGAQPEPKLMTPTGPYDAEPRARWGWLEPGPPAPKDEPLRPWLRHDTEWSSEQDFRGEFGQQTAFGEGIE